MRYSLWQSTLRTKRGDIPLRHLSKNLKHASVLSLMGLAVLAALSGCRNRAYNDLYIENMAAEIRDLEDQLYEYDHEYRLLEQEIAVLRQQNGQLRSPASESSLRKGLFSPKTNQSLNSNANSGSTSPLLFEPRGQRPIAPEPMLNAEEVPYQEPSILEKQGSRADELPAPALESPSTQQSSPSRLTPIPPANPSEPGSVNPNAPGQRPKLPPSLDETPPVISPSVISPPGFPASKKTPNKKSSSGQEFDINDLDELLPPTINFGEPSPPPLPNITQNESNSSLPLENNFELNLRRIEVPGKLASQTSDNRATIKVASEKVTDTRVVELAFHPSLSRAINLDDRDDDDGLYLVLQPKNERGQMVPVAAALTIFVLDPNREGDKAKIGRWEYSAADVQSKLEPIGTNQGIHFTLPWNGPDPSADRVMVFALYKFDNGQQIMGEKEIFLRSQANHKTVWAPRVPGGVTNAGVAQAGIEAQPQAKNVVRPASGAGPALPAPAPSLDSPPRW